VTDENLRKEIEDIWHTLRGNGGAGFFERVRLLELQLQQNDVRVTRLETVVKNVQTTVSHLEEQNVKQAAEWRGFKRAVTIMGAVITFLIAGGYAAIVATLRVMLG
jgi:hypothetical protein